MLFEYLIKQSNLGQKNVEIKNRMRLKTSKSDSNQPLINNKYE